MADPFDYLASRDDADALIQDFGASVSVRRTTDSGTPFNPSTSTTDYGTFAVKVDFTMKQMQSGWALQGAERWIIAAGPLDALGITMLAPNDALVINGVARDLVKVAPLAPAGTAVLFDCQCAT